MSEKSKILSLENKSYHKIRKPLYDDVDFYVLQWFQLRLQDFSLSVSIVKAKA